MSDAVLRKIEKRLDKKLAEQSRNALSEVFTQLSCKAVAREIKAGKNVTGNAEFGVRTCVHDKVGPRYDPVSKRFHPQTKRGRELEHGFIKNVNLLLAQGGYKEMSPQLLPKLRKQDREFEKKVRRR